MPRLVDRYAYPSLNVWEEGDKVFAEAEVPGLKKEDLEISVVGNQLSISGKRPEEAADKVLRRRRDD